MLNWTLALTLCISYLITDLDILEAQVYKS